MPQSSLESLVTQRSLFPALQNKTYFNYGGQGVLPLSSIEIIAKTYQFVQETGPFHSGIFAWLQSEQDITRNALAAELGGAGESYAITQNATEGCNIGLWGVDWQPGDHLLSTDSEHVGVIHALQQIQRRRKIDVTFCPLSTANSKDEMVEIIAGAIQPRTRMVLISHVLWNTGQVLPLEEIVEACHKKNVLVLVDGAQSAGALAVNLASKNCADLYAITGHKWMCGPEGVGTLYIAPDAMEQIQPTFVGWRGSTMDLKTGQPTGFTPGAARFEVGTAPIPLLSALRNSMSVHTQFASLQDREKLILSKANDLIGKLSRIDRVECLLDHAESGLVSFRIHDASHRDVVNQLDQRKVYVRTIPFPDCIRASVHYLTAQEELQTLADALEDIVVL
jgi:L-cysteine/cystine lyase